jgi:hypothetical protein
MKTYDLYGTRAMSIDELQAAAGAALQISLERRDNDDLGYYYRARVGDEIFDIVRNFSDDRPEDEVLKPEFADYPVLFYVSRTDRPNEIQDLLLDIEGLEHLKREML